MALQVAWIVAASMSIGPVQIGVGGVAQVKSLLIFLTWFLERGQNVMRVSSLAHREGFGAKSEAGVHEREG